MNKRIEKGVLPTYIRSDIRDAPYRNYMTKTVILTTEPAGPRLRAKGRRRKSKSSVKSAT